MDVVVSVSVDVVVSVSVNGVVSVSRDDVVSVSIPLTARTQHLYRKSEGRY